MASYADIKQFLLSSDNILIAFSGESVDEIAAGLALGLVLKEAGKNVSFLASQLPSVQLSQLVAIDKVADQIDAGDLQISFDYPLENIEKVSYNDDEGKLNLIVKAKPGSEVIGQEQILIKYQKTIPRIGVVIGNHSFLKDKGVVEKAEWLWINNQPSGEAWAKFVLNDNDKSFSEMIFDLIGELGLNLAVDAGKNIIEGLRAATSSFAIDKTSPAIFEIAAHCSKIIAGQKSEVAVEPEKPIVKEEPKLEGVEQEKVPESWLKPRIFQGATTPKG